MRTRNHVETATSDAYRGSDYLDLSPSGVAKEQTPLARNNNSELDRNEPH